MNERLDIVVIGAGVVGLAVGRVLAMIGRDVVVLEAEPGIGMHQSSRNSEVIHAGLYYAEDSLKARLCVRGRDLLYDYCRAKGIPHQRIGKLIVAAYADDVDRLKRLREQAVRNGVSDLAWLTGDEARQLEPEVASVAALLSPSTGIVDSHAYMLALRSDVESAGGVVVTNSRVENVRVVGDGFEFAVAADTIRCKKLVNAAGFRAPEIAAALGCNSDPVLHAQPASSEFRYAKGHYFAYQGKSPFGHLVYPLPSGGGLGIHVTNDLAGAARFGPDVEWINVIDYSFSENRKAAFVTAIRRYYPGLDDTRLVPGYTGIRAKLHGPDEPAADFVIEGPENHGVSGLVNLLGIDSPGLTASLAIGEYAAALAQ